METAQPLIHPDSVLDISTLREHFKRRTTQDDWRLANAANATLAIMEAKTMRALKERVWLAAVNKTVTTTADSETVTGSGFSTLRVGLDAVGPGALLGTRVVAIASDVSMTVRPAPNAAGAGVTWAFGSKAFRTRHPGGCEVMMPTFPARELIAVRQIETDGTTTTLDITNHLLDSEAGIVRLVTERPYTGALIDIECVAGYRAPSGLDLGHPNDWFKLQHLAIRLCEVLYNDYAMLLGHSVEVNLGQHSIRFLDLTFPADIESMLADFADWRL